MTFDIYAHEEEGVPQASEELLVEAGLSRGELCQSLLDRLREARPLEYPQGFVVAPSAKLKDWEHVLYKVYPESLKGYWRFPQESLLVVGEEE